MMKIRKIKSNDFVRGHQTRQPNNQFVFRRGANLDMQRLHKIASEQSYRRQANKKIKIHKFAIYSLVMLAAVVAVLYLFVTKINTVNIKLVDARVNQAASRQYENSVYKTLGSSWLGNLKPFINTSKISSDLLKTYPEINKISIKNNPLSNNLTVVLNFKNPALIWQTKNGQRFYVSDSGQAFKVNYTHVGDDSLVKLYDTSGLTTVQGETVTSNYEINFVTSVNRQLKQLRIDIEQYSIPASSKEVNLKIKGKSYVVKLLSSNDAGQEVAQLKQSLGYFKKYPDQIPQKYLDLRIIGKAFYQ